ncbi:MAG: hypothetical protein ACXWZF_12130 [Actinomycetota bacterium]
MVRRISLLVLMVSLLMVAAIPARAGVAGIHRTHQHRAREYSRWALGSSPSPLLASLEGPCGGVVGGRFFIAPPIAENLELWCDVPAGTPIVFSHAAWFTFIPADGSTDAEIIAAADAGFAPVSSWVTFDGDRVGTRGKTYNLGAFTIHSKPGSFLDAIEVGTGPIRTSLTATFLTIPPQRCGRHLLESAVDFGVPDEVFSGTYHITIGGCDGDD